MNTDAKSALVIVLENECCRMGASLDSDVAMTFIAVASEDPKCWDDVIGYWPRYRTPVVPKFVDSLPISIVDRETAKCSVNETGEWVVIDLAEKRIVTGRHFMPIGRDESFAMVVDEKGKQHCPLSVHLPPWWELHEQVDASVLELPRQSPINVPQVRRDVLYDDAMIGDLAIRILDKVRNNPWLTGDADDTEHSRHGLTIEVHRDWLMTPLKDLGGMMPRQMLHGAHDWIDHLVWGQRIRFEDGGPIIAAPDDVSGYESAPMGSEEMVIYFDLCRELIEAGWSWCQTTASKSGLNLEMGSQRELFEFLHDFKSTWLSQPFEGGSPPSFIIECSRRRVPRGVGVPIVGMSERETEEHVIDCDCPICNMMAEEMFGPCFAQLDGHHLDLDDEFAFSMHETREAWEKQQREFAESSAEFNRKWAEREAAAGGETDEFKSAWSGNFSEAPLPGDPSGNLKLAFLLTEVISLLDSSGASSADIKQLNTNFINFRKSEPDELAESGKHLCEHLESLAGHYPELVPRVADFQSRIEERVRAPACENDTEFPF